MWDLPNYTITVEAQGRWDFLQQLESAVPGALAWGVRRWIDHRGVSRKRRLRIEKTERCDLEGLTECEIYVPLHGAWLIGRALTLEGMSYSVLDTCTDGIDGWDNSDEGRAATEQEGRRLTQASISRGELRPHVIDIATPYQFMGVAWTLSRPWVLNVWSAGAGKTLGAIMAVTARQGSVLVIVPAKARHVWWSQVQEYTTLKPFRVRPVSERKQKDPTLDEYLQDCRVNNTRPFVVMGAESLSDNMDVVHAVSPAIVIFDELHIWGSRKRWKAIQEADGTVSFERRKTAASERKGSKVDRENRAVAAMDVSRLKCLELRVGLTATPLDDGRPRRLWSQLDLLSPGGFSHSYSKYALRYCDARAGQYGGLDDTGSSNMTELKQRCSYLFHEVPYSESHAALPDTRVQVVYLSNTELNRAERWNDDKTFGQALKSLAKEVKSGNEDARTRVVEARLSEACSRKRRYVIDEVKEGLKGGGKVVVFTARRRETELWAHEVRRAATRGDEALGEVPVWMAHGGVPESERDGIIDAFRESSGPCCLVATGQSVGTGVDGMQTADLAIFAMLPWKPGDFMQWKGRFDRLGGSATLLKVPVAVSTYDERVVSILVDKFGPIESFLRADELRGLDEKLLGLENKDGLLDSIVSKLGEA